MLHGHPVSTSLAGDPTFVERFWYWRGSSGRDYIHSIYQKASCPPLNAAVVVLVRTSGGGRRALGVSRMDGSGRTPAECLPGWSEADEVHVHLLAQEADRADAIRADLARALTDEVQEIADEGFAETGQLDLGVAA